ncbi:hypothetical protein QE152_g25914 [Popillia japonica]|uniref:Uncharacterized protein n=1 Tax=Popillia japonica TaxID=7064 RepID=A0AAW1JZH5_POPJA
MNLLSVCALPAVVILITTPRPRITILYNAISSLHPTAREIQEEDSEVTQTPTPEDHQKDFQAEVELDEEDPPKKEAEKDHQKDFQAEVELDEEDPPKKEAENQPTRERRSISIAAPIKFGALEAGPSISIAAPKEHLYCCAD